MVNGHKKDRKFKRIPFPSTKNIKAVCKVVANAKAEPVHMHIANLSEGGVGLIAKKELVQAINVNDILILDKIVGVYELDFVKNIELEVKWLMVTQIMENAGVGCSFTNISNSVKAKLLAFINSMEALAD